MAVVASAGIIAAPGAAPAATESFTTPGQHIYTAPDGVTRVDVLAVGGEGARITDRRGGRGATDGTLAIRKPW